MALTTVNSDGVKDDSIKNIDIKSDAAIEASKLDDPLNFADNHKVSFGNTGTGKLELFHHSSDWNIIRNTAGGGLFIESATDITGIEVQASEVKLKYLGGQRFETTASGSLVSLPSTATGHTDFEVKGANDQSAKITLSADEGTDDNDRIRLFQSTNGNFYIQHNTDKDAGAWESAIQTAPNGAAMLFYDGGQNTTPKLETQAGGVGIAGDTTTSGKFISDNGSSGDYVRLYNGSGTGGWDIYGSGANLRISDNAGTPGAFVIDTKVGIATTSPSSALDVNGEISLPFNNTLRWLESDGTVASDMYTNSGNTLIFRNNSGAETANLDTSGNLELAGNLKVPSGKGINFSAYATSGNPSSNLLDDYETGTFTPAWQGSTTAGNPTYGQNMGRYTKIGNTVHCNGYSEITGNGGTAPAGTNFYLNNLPFVSAANASMPYECGSVMFENLNFADAAKWWVTFKPADNTKMYLYYTQDNGAWSHLNCDDTVFNIIWSLTYKVG